MDKHGQPFASADQPADADLRRELTQLRAQLQAAQAREAVLQQRLDQQDQLIDGLSQHVPGGLMVLDRLPNGHRRAPFASVGLAKLFDIDIEVLQQPDELVAQMLSRVHPEHIHTIRRWEIEAEAGAKELIGDILIVPRDGQQRWIAMHLGVQMSEHGHRVWYGIVQDITERHKLARRLKARDALLNSLSRNLPGALYKVAISADGQPQLQYVSERAGELFELQAVPGQPMSWEAQYPRIHPDDLEMVKRLSSQQAQEESKLLQYEFRVVLPSKGLRWLAGQSVSLREADGRVAWYGYTADVTEQKLYADAVISAEAAQRANQAKSEFLSRMSHELRTPLNAVIGFAQLLQMDQSNVLGAEPRSRVRLIEKAGKHLLSMLGDVLDLSRIEAGDLPLSMEAQDVDLIIDETVQMVGEQGRGNHIQIDTQGVRQHVYALADRLRLRQVLVNLLGNAIKYNRPHGQIFVSARREDAGIVIEVRDTGIGMTAEQQSHLFEPFNRLGAEKTGIEGTGIGLVIVRRLLVLMGGDISVSSQAGVGSTFRITLAEAEAAPMPSDQVPLLDAPPACKPATILYAEDNEINVMLVHQVIKLRPHWRLIVATSGERALALAQRSVPDLMLIDMHLGDMTGFDLANALDQDPSLSQVPRVALSADAMPDRIHQARARGFKAYLTKPLDVLALLRNLDELLS